MRPVASGAGYSSTVPALLVFESVDSFGDCPALASIAIRAETLDGLPVSAVDWGDEVAALGSRRYLPRTALSESV
jgi:hypothetical protein